MGVFNKIWDFVLGADRQDATCTSSDTHVGKANPPHVNTASYRSPALAAQRRAARPPLQNEGLGGELPVGPSIIQDVEQGATGGVQGLDWYRRSLKEDADGDVAEAFLCESPRPSQVAPGPSSASATNSTVAHESMPPAVHPPLLEVHRKRTKRLRHARLVIEHGNVHLVTQ